MGAGPNGTLDGEGAGLDGGCTEAAVGAALVPGAAGASEAAALISTSDWALSSAAMADTAISETASRVPHCCKNLEQIVLLVTGLFQTKSTYNRAPFEAERRAIAAVFLDVTQLCE